MNNKQHNVTCHDSGCHKHNHSHFLLEIILYFVGVAMHIVAYFTAAMPAMILNLVGLLLAGHHVLFEGIVDTIKNSINARRFRPNIHILMALGAFGAIYIKEYSEAALLILIFAGAHFLEQYAETKSQKEITSLLAMNPTSARKFVGDEVVLVDVDELEIGDLIHILPGDQIGADGVVISGESVVDEKAITGESAPVFKDKDAIVFASTINSNGTLVVEVTKASSDTVFAKIITLVQDTQKNITKTAAFIKKFEPIYVTLVLLLAPLFYLFAHYALDLGYPVAFQRTMILLIGASPCALAVSDIPASLSALSALAKRGVLFKGGNALSVLGKAKAVVFDKTGTLTVGKPEVTDVLFLQAISSKEQTEITNVIVNMERKANHPLAEAIIAHFNAAPLFSVATENIIGVGLKAHYEDNVYEITKPVHLDKVDPKLLATYSTLSEQGKTIMFIRKNDVVVALLATRDLPKESACAALTYLKRHNIHTVMLTGDGVQTSRAIGEQLGVDHIVANVLPHEKKDYIDELRKTYTPLVMVGDGVNDAPALVSADVGIAMGDGTDVAIEVADAVLVKNDLTRVMLAHKVSKKLSKIVLQNIIFAMAVVFFLIVINTVLPLPMWVAVTVHEGSTLVVIINGLRLLRPLNIEKILCPHGDNLQNK